MNTNSVNKNEKNTENKVINFAREAIADDMSKNHIIFKTDYIFKYMKMGNSWRSRKLLIILIKHYKFLPDKPICRVLSDSYVFNDGIILTSQIQINYQNSDA